MLLFVRSSSSSVVVMMQCGILKCMHNFQVCKKAHALSLPVSVSHKLSLSSASYLSDCVCVCQVCKSLFISLPPKLNTFPFTSPSCKSREIEIVVLSRRERDMHCLQIFSLSLTVLLFSAAL